MKNNERVSQSRRKVILGSAAGATALTVWQKPSINSVILPAHATTSDPAQIFTLSGTADSIFQDIQRIQQSIIQAYPEAAALYSTKGSEVLAKASLPQKVFEFVVPSAYAQSSSSEDFVGFYLADNGDDTYKFQWYSSDTYEDCVVENLFYVDSVAIGDTEYMSGFNCFYGIAASGEIDMTLVSIADDLSSAVIEIDGSGEIELMLDLGGEEFEMPSTCPCVLDIESEEPGSE